MFEDMKVSTRKVIDSILLELVDYGKVTIRLGTPESKALIEAVAKKGKAK